MKIVKNILFWVTTVLLVLAIAAVAVPKLFGVEFRAVLTGSMEPEIPVGSLVVIVPTEAEKIQIGDDITFVSEGGKVVTHRVIEIDRDKNTFTTYGIANGISNRDAANRYENIIGVVKFHAPAIGQLFIWFATAQGKIISITAILALYLITALLSVLFGKKKEPAVQTETGFDFAQDTVTQPRGSEPTQKMNGKTQICQAAKPKGSKKIKPENTDDFWNGEDIK